MSRNDPTSPPLTTEQLVADTVASLRDAETDHALLDILAAHIATLAPAETAVEDALGAIEALAAKRAEENADDAVDKH